MAQNTQQVRRILDAGQAVAEFRRGDYGNRYTVAACGATEVGVLTANQGCEGMWMVETEVR